MILTQLTCPAQYNCTFEYQDLVWWHAPLIGAGFTLVALVAVGLFLWFAAKHL